MLINNTLFVTLSICLAIFIGIGLYVLIKRKFDSYYGVLLGLILSGFGFGALQSAFGKIYLISENFQVQSYRHIGEVKFTFENEETIVLDFPRGKTGILNNSNASLIIDEIVYGPEGFYKNSTEYKEMVSEIDPKNHLVTLDNNKNKIPSFSFKTRSIKKHTIDFFFDDEIPSSIKEYGSYGNVLKYWLHEKE